MVGALLTAEGYDVREASNGAAGINAIADDEPDVALLDLMMPGELDGLATLTRIREKWAELPIVMMSGKASLGDAVKATKLGAINFLEKPLSPETVLLALSSAIELRRSRRVARTLREDLGLTGEMVGSSIAMKQVADIIARVAPSDSRVLIGGESGTGKELVAAAIHEQSGRRDRPFVRVNCAAIPRDLVESEMFGHEKGSFTGATNTRVGRFELAHTGTLFLDEIGDLGIEAQAKLLRAIEAREIQRVGGNKTISVDVRVIAATNKDLSKAVQEGTFREDLYFRLNVIPIPLPPLRDRGDDVIELIHHFSNLQFQRSSRSRLQWSDEALKLMKKYQWPGNVRELANIVERISILNTGSEVKASDVVAVLPSFAAQTGTGSVSPQANKSLTEALDDTERALIDDALARSNGSVAEAARQLQTDRPNLYRRMKRLGITGLILLIGLIPSGADAQTDSSSNDQAAYRYSARESTDTIEHIEPLLSLRRSYFGHTLGFGVTSGGVFNRVEGLPIHFGPSYSYSSRNVLVRARAYGIVRSARGFQLKAPHGGYNIHTDVYFGESRTIGMGVRWFRIVSPVEQWNFSDPENALAGFLLHRDYRDYYDRQGVKGTLSWQVNQKATITLGLSDEKWNSIDERDPFTILRNSHPWRPNPFMDEGDFKIASIDATLDTRNDEREPTGGWFISSSIEQGQSSNVVFNPLQSATSPAKVRYGRATVDIRRYNRLSPRTQVNGRLFVGGWLYGDDLPLQKKFSIGGPGTLPGYDFRKMTGKYDVFTCGSLSLPLTGMPAMCDRVFLTQLEFRRQLSEEPFDILNNPAIRIRSAGFTVSPQGVLFADIGRGWRRADSLTPAGPLKADVGAGLDLGLLGIYVAKSVTDWSEAANIFVRVSRRF